MTDAKSGMSDEAVVAATGKNWAGWKRFLDDAGAGKMSHGDIAKFLKKNGVGPWWRQMVSVGYERMIGRRVVGQNCEGNFSAGASRALSGDMDSALARWVLMVEGQVEFAGALASGEPRVTSSDKWCYWRIDLDNGSRVTVHFSKKSDEKCTAGINHDKLADQAAVTEVKVFWKALLVRL